MKVENLHSLERGEHNYDGEVDVRMCGVSLKDRKHSEVLNSPLVIQSMAEVVKHGRLR